MDEIPLRPAESSDVEGIAEVYLAPFRATYDFPRAHTDVEVRRWLADVVLPTEEVWRRGSGSRGGRDDGADLGHG